MTGSGEGPVPKLPTFATRPVTLFTLADTIFFYLLAVRTAGADA